MCGYGLSNLVFEQHSNNHKTLTCKKKKKLLN